MSDAIQKNFITVRRKSSRLRCELIAPLVVLLLLSIIAAVIKTSNPTTDVYHTLVQQDIFPVAVTNSVCAFDRSDSVDERFNFLAVGVAAEDAVIRNDFMNYIVAEYRANLTPDIIQTAAIQVRDCIAHSNHHPSHLKYADHIPSAGCLSPRRQIT